MQQQPAGVVVLFHPDMPVVAQNIQTYLPYLSRLYVISNTPGEADQHLQHLLDGLGGNITFVHNSRNEGIAHALNQGAALALRDGAGWLLTMDQDSYFEPAAAVAYFELFAGRFMPDAAAGIIAPNSTGIAATGLATTTTEEVTAVITSGSLLQLSVWQKTGGFNNALFIDEVDFDYCYRIRQQGYLVIYCPAIPLSHQLGTKKTAGYMGGVVGKRSRTVHSPQRVYFMVRNYLYVRSQYRQLFPAEFKKRDKQLQTALKNNLLFSGHFFATFRQILRGFADYKNLLKQTD